MSSSTRETDKLPTSGGGKPVGLGPGIYVAARRLNQSGLASLGRHQFVFALPKAMCFLGETSLGGATGIVIGAYNIDGRLQPALNAPSDAMALKNYLRGTGSLEVSKVRYTSVDLGISHLINGYRHYLQHENAHKIAYPESGGMSLTGCRTDTTYNSNSWAQSLVHHRLGPNLVRQDFSGIDICNATRIPSEYFR